MKVDVCFISFSGGFALYFRQLNVWQSLLSPGVSARPSGPWFPFVLKSFSVLSLVLTSVIYVHQRKMQA